MTNGSQKIVSLGEGANEFLSNLSKEKREISQQEVYNFVRWYGRERPFNGLTPPEIANYAEILSSSDTDQKQKLEILRAFLAYAKKSGWAEINLGVHLKAKKKPNMTPAQNGNPEVISLTEQGHKDLSVELEELKVKRLQAIADMTKAAADKDFRENAPFHAAREQKSFLDGRIREIEETLKLARIVECELKPALKTSISDTVMIIDVISKREFSYAIVHPTEVDPRNGKISCESPIGKAVIGRGEGEVVEVLAPAGRLKYQIKKVEHYLS